MTSTTADIVYIYADTPHPIGSVELLPDGTWCASTRHRLIGIYPDRESAIEAVYAAIDGGAS